jgi:hypothetical protein
VISIRRNGQRLFHAALAGASADNDGWLDRKCAVVDRYGRSSLRVGEQFRVDGKSFDQDSRLDMSEYAAHGGAFPVLVRGVGCIGTVAVSGLPSWRTTGSWSRPSKRSWQRGTRPSECRCYGSLRVATLFAGIIVYHRMPWSRRPRWRTRCSSS